ncbi:MAG TPA: acyltransferase [Prosthecobacter sp.]
MSVTKPQTGETSIFHGIQALRGVFAVLVVCHHVGVQSLRYWQHDWLGGVFNQSTFRVDFFFVLSGFALWTAHQADAGTPGAWRAFLGRRLLRIYPLLIILTLVKALLLCCVPGRSLESYYLIPSLLALPQDSFPIIVAAWTLSFEIWFTILMTACLLLPRRAVLPALVGGGVLVAWLGVFLDIRPGLNGAGFVTHPFVLEFAAGVLVAEWVRRRLRHHQEGNLVLGIVLSAGAFVATIVAGTQHSWIASHPVIWQKVCWALVFAAGLGGMALWERSVEARKWWLRDSAGLGRASYSIFLCHGFVLMGFFAVLGKGWQPAGAVWMNVLLVLVVVLSVLVGSVVWKYLEQPLGRLCRLPRRPAPAKLPRPVPPLKTTTSRGSVSQQLS